MGTWLLPRTELTPAQLRAIELRWKTHQVVVGAPGSGKTQILLHRAKYLRDSIGCNNYRIFVYTNVLKDYIRSSLSLLDIPEEAVTTYDSWCKSLYQDHVRGRLPRKGRGGPPDFVKIRQKVQRLFRQGAASMPRYDFVLVDEAQDLAASSLETVARVAGHATVCLDSKQQIYEGGSSLDQVVAAMGTRPRSLYLLDAYRCSPFVAKLAARFIASEDERRYYENQVRTVEVEQQVPLLFRSRNAKEERDRLRQILRERIDLGHRAAVLLPLRRQVFGFARGLREAGFDVETMEDLDFATNRPKVLTYSSAKGLTFDSVLVPRLVPKSFGRWSRESIRQLLFVAITRAKDWVYMSTVVGRELEALNLVYPLEKGGGLTIQSEWTGGGRTSDRDSGPGDVDPLDFL